MEFARRPVRDVVDPLPRDPARGDGPGHVLAHDDAGGGVQPRPVPPGPERTDQRRAPQPRQAVPSPGRVGREQDLGVAIGPELPTRPRQFRLQLAVIVDRPVEDEDVTPGAHRLASLRRVDDRQPRHAERGVAARDPARVIRSALALRRDHRGDRGFAPARVELGGDNAGDAAHRINSLGQAPPLASDCRSRRCTRAQEGGNWRDRNGPGPRQPPSPSSGNAHFRAKP